jgi:hypothetical protein
MEKEDDILSKFESFKKNEPYKVPDHYFDSIVSRVQDKILVSEKKKEHAGKLFRKPVIAMSFLVLSVAFIILMSTKELMPFWSKSDSTSNKTDEIALFLEHQAYSLDDVTLADALEVNSDLPTVNPVYNDTINYLLDNSIESNEILNEL